jgi:hypothetical protein
LARFNLLLEDKKSEHLAFMAEGIERKRKVVRCVVVEQKNHSSGGAI